MVETTAKRRRGRKKIGRRYVVIVPESDWTAWREIAEQRGTTVSATIRRLMAEWAQTASKRDRNDSESGV